MILYLGKWYLPMSVCSITAVYLQRICSQYFMCTGQTCSAYGIPFKEYAGACQDNTSLYWDCTADGHGYVLGIWGKIGEILMTATRLCSSVKEQYVLANTGP